MRGREFLMKDMYSFDIDEETALETYDEARKVYDWFFTQIGLPYVTVTQIQRLGLLRLMRREEILEGHCLTNITISQMVSPDRQLT